MAVRTRPKPSLELLRSLTDEHVLRALMRQRRLTRAELAAATGMSKPTVGESVRRLAEAGLVADTGERTAGGRGRGRVGSYYALADHRRRALAVSIAPEGVVAECVDAYGDTVPGPPRRPSGLARPAQVGAACGRGRRGHGTAPGRPRGWPWSAPPIRWTGPPGGWSSCPTSPFLLGELDPGRDPGPARRRPGHRRQRRELGGAGRARPRQRRPPGRLRLCLPGRGTGLRRHQRRRGQPRARRPGWRDRAPDHRRPARAGHPPDRGIRRAGPAAGRLDGHRRRPPPRRGRRPGAQAADHAPASSARPSAGYSPPSWRSPTRGLSSSAAPGAATR